MGCFHVFCCWLAPPLLQLFTALHHHPPFLNAGRFIALACGLQVMPEVAAKEAEEAAAREAARLAAAKALAEGKGPALPSVLEESDEEETPDLEYQVCGIQIQIKKQVTELGTQQWPMELGVGKGGRTRGWCNPVCV
jgi:hypothetical protein